MIIYPELNDSFGAAKIHHLEIPGFSGENPMISGYLRSMKDMNFHGIPSGYD
jgi:hypothetical protein